MIITALNKFIKSIVCFYYRIRLYYYRKLKTPKKLPRAQHSKYSIYMLISLNNVKCLLIHSSSFQGLLHSTAQVQAVCQEVQARSPGQCERY
jgi:hypothetical protein